jgi:hypothetical protein
VDWVKAHKKALAGFISGCIAAAGSLLSLGILGEAQSHGLTVAIAFLTPLLIALGVGVGPANVPAPEPVQPIAPVEPGV